MLSEIDLESLIANKKREIEREKTLLGLSKFPLDHMVSILCVYNS